MALVQKSFSDIITFSRSSNATRVGPTGLVEYAPHNLILQSQTFDNASWTKTRSSVSANAAAAPDGTVTADTMIEDTTATNSHVIYQSASLGAGVYTASCYFKKNTRSFACLRISTNSDVQKYSVTINLDTGAFGSTSSDGSPTNTSYSIVNAGNGWYRLSVTTAHTSGLVYVTAAVSNAAIPTYDGSALPIYTGDGTSGIYLWGAQLSVGPYALDYTPTTSAAVYGPRFDYDPVTLAARGLLIEESRTNLATYSEDFSNAAWTANDVTVSANAAASPDGTVTADTLTENTAASTHRVFQILTSTAAAYTASVFAKAGTRNWIYLRVRDSGNVDRHAWFNLSTGAVGTTESGITASIQALGNGWYRCIATIATASSGGANQPVVIGMASADNTTTYTGNGTGSVSLWGAQLEAGSFATSYIPTLASTVTRSADVASVNTLSPWFNATEGTLFAEASRPALGGAAAFACLSTDANNRIQIGNRTGGGGTARLDYWVSTLGVDQSYLTFDNTFAANTPAKIAGAYKADDFAASANGATTKTDSSGSVPAIVSLLLGANTTTPSTILNGHLRRVAFFPRRLSDAELQALTS